MIKKNKADTVENSWLKITNLVIWQFEQNMVS